ncbi:phage tail tape measure protein [Streptomyces sp. NPDC005202]|uniref:phage tail tape measure protein n=1 Tax=Streptomyces sp. NPDC005202 TaxID=3157021 RepID=UPI0033BCFF81
MTACPVPGLLYSARRVGPGQGRRPARVRHGHRPLPRLRADRPGARSRTRGAGRVRRQDHSSAAGGLRGTAPRRARGARPPVPPGRPGERAVSGSDGDVQPHRAQANSLISGLRSAADAARALGLRTREVDSRLAALDASSRRAARQVDLLGARAQTAGSRLGALGSRGSRTGSQLRRAGSDAGTLERSLRSVGRQATALSRLLAGGALVLGTGQLVEEGNRYQREMNAFQAVTGATAGQMQRAAWMANQLGIDLTLPTTTAADAAEAMVELAKAGFLTDQAITATRASLQLASAAGVSAADSARYLGDIMDQFGLSADQAARASDILAATANNASGGIIDIYYAMRYAGPVAAGLGVSMEDAATAVGMLGKAGILGRRARPGLRFPRRSGGADQLQGWTISAIARQLGRNLKAIRAYLNGEKTAGHRLQGPDAFVPFLDYCRQRLSDDRICGPPRCSTRWPGWLLPTGCSRRSWSR